MNVPRQDGQVKHTVGFKLFITGQTSNALKAREALKRLIENRPDEAFDVEVVDVLANPDAAMRNNIFATPTLICSGLGRERRMVGDLSSPAKIEAGLMAAAKAPST